MCRIADAHPHTHLLAFTKAFEIVNRYEDREAVPANLVIVFSAWPGMRFLNPHGHRVAWMQGGTETRVPEDAIGCPGNCETGGLCYELPRLGRENGSLRVCGVDLLDGTPILVIKPYLSNIPVDTLRRGWLAEAEARKA
jgi:hypothetical protein